MSTRVRGALALSLLLTTVVGAPALAAPPPKVDIKFDQFTLPNGLRVIVHTDRKAPIVAVNVWYHVGSKDEPVGRSGFAHLFEHLMFQGSENHKGEFFDPFALVGTTGQNGTTSQDRTNYFENVPTTALDMALWMESDRMGHLLGALDQAALDEQRGVVQNEKRLGENRPYGQDEELLYQATYPEGHPYHHTVIGSMADLNAATLDDVKGWFRSWYGPNNAVLVLAGDIDLATAKVKVARYFGDIAPTATVKKLKAQVAARTTSTRAQVADAVPQTRIYRVWNVPGAATAEGDRLRLLAHILGGARASRLDRRLAHGDKLVDRISASLDASELGGQFVIQADVKAGGDPAVVEKAIDEELRALLKRGPSAAELAQAKTVFAAGFVRGVERIGGFGGKADVLAGCAVFTGKASCFKDTLATTASATAGQLKAVGAKWLGKGDHTLVIVPGKRTPLPEAAAVANLAPTVVPPPAKSLKTITTDVDRTKGVPTTDAFPPLVFPTLTRATLSNGLKVVLVERHGLPLVQLSLEVQGAGFSSDAPGKSGVASFAMGMLDEGAGAYGALALGDRLEGLGAQLGTGAGLDQASLYLSSLTTNLEPSLALLADVLMRPTFDANELERVRATWLAGIKQEKAQPGAIAGRVLPALLYGAGHPYAVPASGSGTEASIAALTRDELRAWVGAHLRPDRATLIVVGDTTLAALQPKLEAAFASWKAPATPAAPLALPTVKLPSKVRVFLVDQPGAIQANITVAQLVPPSTDAGAIALEFANDVIGGDFSARINMNLREAKHWAYGAYSGTGNALGQRRWGAGAAVQIDKTSESVKELEREIRTFATGAAPAKADEITRVQAGDVRALPGAYETAAALMGTLSGIVLYQRPDDYPVVRAARETAMKPADIATAAATIKPGALTWVIVGDLAKIEPGIRALKLGEVKVIDVDGKILR